MIMIDQMLVLVRVNNRSAVECMQNQGISPIEKVEAVALVES